MMAAHAHDHGHSHVHDHDAIDWSAFRTNRLLQAVLALVAISAAATIVALVVLWPSSDGRDSAVEQGALIGLGSERFGATVTSVETGTCSYATSSNPSQCRRVAFVVNEGRFAGETHMFQEFNLAIDSIAPDLVVDDSVMAGYEPTTDVWFYADRDRRTSLVVLGLLFAAVVVALGRWRGLAALAGMAVTLAVLVVFVARSVLDGNDPLLVAVVAAAAIAFVSLYLTHGFTPTTTVALAGTLISLALTLGLASAFFAMAKFTGLATEEALLLPFIAGDIDLSALLLGGAMLGTLGALDDVTVTQVATVSELHRRSPELGVKELVNSGIRVGRDHIASTVNTLLLAYAGASMPLLLLFAASNQGLDKVANSELISVEIVRTLCGSVGLVAAVPITTVLAAFITERTPVAEPSVAAESVAPTHGQCTDGSVAAATTEPVPNHPAANDPAAASKPQSQPSADWDDFAPRENW